MHLFRSGASPHLLFASPPASQGLRPDLHADCLVFVPVRLRRVAVATLLRRTRCVFFTKKKDYSQNFDETLQVFDKHLLCTTFVTVLLITGFLQYSIKYYNLVNHG